MPEHAHHLFMPLLEAAALAYEQVTGNRPHASTVKYSDAKCYSFHFARSSSMCRPCAVFTLTQFIVLPRT
jgi:hypothetical protein